MEILNSFDITRKHKWLWLLPTVLSLAGLLVALLLGFFPTVKTGFHLKFYVPSGMPSLGSILQLEQLEISTAVTAPTLLFVIGSLVVNTFFSGGWLATVFAALRGQELTREELWEQSRYFFGRLLVSRLLTLFGTIFGLLFLAMILGPIVLLLAVAILFYTFFWELAIVCEDLSVGEGFTRGHQLLRANFGEVLGTLLPMAVLCAMFSAIANFIAQTPLGYVLLIPIWSYLGGSLSVMVCGLYKELTQRPLLTM